MANDKDTVPGLGFKDKDKALETIKNLEGRDSDYQKLAVKGLIGRAKRTLQVTKAEDKLTNIKEALTVFEKWLKDFEKLHIPNWSYLPLATVETFLPWQKHLEVNNEQLTSFLKAYRSCDGDYKKLRTVHSEDDEPTWDIVRNKKLGDLLKKVDDDDLDMWDDDELPTKMHTELIMWAYSPDASRIKKQLTTLQEKVEKYKTNDSEEKEKTDNGDAKKASKRKSGVDEDDSSEEDEDESPKKKKASE